MILTSQFIERYVAQIKRLWIARVDNYAQYQITKGVWYQTLTDTQLYQHARGEFPSTPLDPRLANRVTESLVGPLILLPCGLTGCWWMVYDLDNKRGELDMAARNEELARELYSRAGQGALLESCGGGSYHVWKFLPDANKTIQFNKAESVASYALTLFPEGRRFQTIPSAVFDNYPRKYVGGRLPGRHHTRDDWSQLWLPNSQTWADYGTEEFLNVLETLQPGQISQVPVHHSTFARIASSAPPLSSNTVFITNDAATLNRPAVLSPCAQNAWKKKEGPLMWRRMYERALTNPSKEQFEAYLNDEKKKIGCSECLINFAADIEANPLPDDPAEIRYWLSARHNTVRRKQQKKEFGREEADAEWATWNTADQSECSQ